MRVRFWLKVADLLDAGGRYFQRRQDERAFRRVSRALFSDWRKR